MFKISTIHQHTSFNPNRRSRRSLGLRTVRDATARVRLDIPFLNSFVIRLSNPNVIPLLPGNSLIILSGPYRIIRYKISINVLTFSVSITSEIIYDIVRDYKKNCRLIITNTIENRHSELVKRSDNKRVSFKNAAAVCDTSGSFSKTATAHRTR